MFAPNENRYDKMVYNRLGNSGLKVSAVSLGLWQNFGFGSDFATAGGIAGNLAELWL